MKNIKSKIKIFTFYMLGLASTFVLNSCTKNDKKLQVEDYKVNENSETVQIENKKSTSNDVMHSDENGLWWDENGNGILDVGENRIIAKHYGGQPSNKVRKLLIKKLNYMRKTYEE